MLISRKHSFAFIHNPKAAGSAIRAALSPFCEKPQEFWHQGYLKGLDRVVDLAHLDAYERKHCPGLPSLDCFDTVFMVIRDPILRFLSAFSEHCRQHERWIDVNQFVLTEMTFGNIQADWKYIHFRPQHMFRKRGEGTRVYSHHSLQDTWPDLCRSLVGEVIELKNVRQDPGTQPEVQDLSREALERLTMLYWSDYQSVCSQYDILVQPRSDGSHEQNMVFIHTPSLYKYVDPSLLSKGELIAYQSYKGTNALLSSV